MENERYFLVKVDKKILTVCNVRKYCTVLYLLGWSTGREGDPKKGVYWFDVSSHETMNEAGQRRY